MSHAYYNELWLMTRNDLEKLLELDRRLQRQRKTNVKARGLNLLVPTYLRYRNLVKRLVVCHDQMVQSQKRDLIKRVLDCSIGRMLEYKREIVRLNCSDYLWPDDVMKQLVFTPDDVELSISAAAKDVVQRRKKMIRGMIEDASKEVEEEKEEDETAKSMNEEESIASGRSRTRKIGKETSTVSKLASILVESLAPEETTREKRLYDAVLLIQSHERARMGRRVGAEVQRMYNYKKKLQMGETRGKKLSKATYATAATTIQRAWRRYRAKKRMKKRAERLENVLNTTIPSWRSEQALEKDRENFQTKLELMLPFVDRVNRKIDVERARLWKIRGPGLMEDITDEVREWLIVWYNEVGHYDVYPAANLGGSILIVTEETLTPQEYLMQRGSRNGIRGKDEAASPIEKGAKKGDTKKKIQTWMPETKAISLLEDANQNFLQNWSFRNDSIDSPNKIYEDLIKDELCYELQLEMRQAVDELMRLELEKLNIALKKDYKADKREVPSLKDKGKRSRKSGRKKKRKDPLEQVSSKDIVKELARADIVRDYRETSLQDWIGDLSYENYEAQREFRDYGHRMGEIKQVVMDYCVLPLSSKGVHEIAPLTRAVCICGLPRHGKSFLVDAVCSEVGALLFDMTPALLVGKYTGRRNERKLINMISKSAREYAPSIIFIDGGEKPWLKKIPLEERANQPRRFAKYYPNLVKSIKRGDQILFLTTSSEPYKARKPFLRIHDAFITIPLTDYNTLYMFYKDLLLKYHGIDRNIDVSCLAKMSVGIPLEFVKNAVENVLNLRRRITLEFKPLNQLEIMEHVFKYQPPATNALTKFMKFEHETPLGRKRLKMLRMEKEMRERMAKQKKK